jgi:hypothetical protein
MPFYFHRSISAGPFRFNLSGSGVGMSVGVKGLRVGTGPHGHYIRAGANGFYYRTSFGHNRTDRRPPASALPTVHGGVGPHVAVERGNVVEMIDSNAAELLNKIQLRFSQMPIWPFAVGTGALSTFLIANAGQQYGTVALVVCVLAVVVSFLLYRRDMTQRTSVLMYDLDDDAIKLFEAFTREFDDLANTLKAMNIETKGTIYDWKRHAGAHFEVKASVASFSYGMPRLIKTNVSIPHISGGRNAIYFFPDLVLVKQGSKIGGLDYRNVTLQFQDQTFQEHESVPADAEVIGSTWRFVRRDGGPDRRFNNNRQIPICRYQAMLMTGPGEFQKVIFLSRNTDRSRFVGSIRALGRLHGSRVMSKDKVQPSRHSALPSPNKVDRF